MFSCFFFRNFIKLKIEIKRVDAEKLINRQTLKKIKMKKILTLLLAVGLSLWLSENSFGQAVKGRPSNSSVAKTAKVKAKKKSKEKKKKGVKRIHKSSKKKKSSAIQRIININHYVIFNRREEELIS